MNDPSRSCRFKLRNICLIRMMIFLTVAYCHMLRLRAHECEARYVWYASRLTTISRLYNPAETPSYIHQETDEFEGTFFIPCLQQGDGFVYLLFVVESDSKEPTLVCAVDTRYRIWSLPCVPVFMLMYRARLLEKFRHQVWKGKSRSRFWIEFWDLRFSCSPSKLGYDISF